MTRSPAEDDPWAGWLDPDAWARWLSGGYDAGWGPWLADASGWRPQPVLPPIADPDAFVAERQAQDEADGVWPTARERLVRHTDGKAGWGIAFLHGFGASRGEGEAVLDPLAAELGANLYYSLLPGHGRTPEDHATAPAEAYLRVAAESLAMAQAIGERVVLVGSSTGGLLATWLAATWPDAVDALVLASPFYAFADPSTLILRLPFGLDAVEWAYGAERDASFHDPRVRDGYDQRWLTDQRTRAVGHLERLRGWLARDDAYAAVRAPVCLLYHPDDKVVSVEAMHYALAHMQPHPHSRFVPIADGNHVLLSRYVRTDKEAITRALRRFFADLDGDAP